MDAYVTRMSIQSGEKLHVGSRDGARTLRPSEGLTCEILKWFVK